MLENEEELRNLIGTKLQMKNIYIFAGTAEERLGIELDEFITFCLNSNPKNGNTQFSLEHY
jgi:hypothetical protein